MNGNLPFKEKYTVVFETDGGSAITNQTVKSGCKAERPNNPIKPGYVFRGWFLNENEWLFDIYTVTENITLTAKWEANNFKYVVEGGEVTITGYSGNADDTIVTPEVIDECNVTKIAKEAFKDHKEIKSVYVSDGVTIVEEMAFMGCVQLTEISLPNSLEKIDIGAFTFTQIKNLYIPKNVKQIDDSAFVYTDVESITVSEENVRYKGVGNCLIDTKTKTLITGCKNSVILNDGSIEIIGSSAFFFTNFVGRVVLPEGLKKISESAFSMCSKITSFYIPDSVTEIDRMAFSGCGFTIIDYNGTMEKWNLISKADDWNNSTGNYIIHCTNGNYSKT